jgi:FkbM family methyltransferase
MKFYQLLTEASQYIIPQIYKQRFFKKQNQLSRENIIERKVEPELLWLTEFLPKDAVFMDVGANVGHFLYQLDYHLFPQNIYAFEPNKSLNKKLKRLFPKVNVFSEALSDENTTAEFKIPVLKGKQVNSRGTLQTDFKEENEEKTVIQKVKVVKLDDFEPLKKLKKLDFIKIDVEGNEMKTLRGAKETILKFKPVLMVEMEQRHHKEPLWNLISEVENWGFEAHYLDRNSFELKKLTEDFINSQNAIFVKDYENYINNIIFIAKA